MTGPAMFDRIASAPGILGGQPVVRCARISVEFILELVASGGSVADLVSADPILTPADVRPAVLFAAGTLKNDASLTAGVA